MMKVSFACLLAVLQLASALRPHFTSNSAKLTTSPDHIAGFGLDEQVFKVYFQENVQGFEASDIEYKASTGGAPLLGYSLEITDFVAVSQQQYTFKVQVAGGGSSTEPPVELTFYTSLGACVGLTTGLNCEASADYTIHYNQGLTSVSGSSSIDQQVVSIDLVFSGEIISAGDQTFPLGILVNGEMVTNNRNTEITFDGAKVSAKYFNADPSDTVCVVPTAAQSVADYYGAILPSLNGENCFQVEADPCEIFTWSEWSDCVFRCKPSDQLQDINTQTRVKEFASGDGAGCSNTTQTRQCELAYTSSCLLLINGMENDNLCMPSTDPGFNSFYNYACDYNDATATPVPEGCRCGGGCEKTNPPSCCQSYYKNCLDNAASDPKLFYSYAPCWKPQVCAVSQDVAGDGPYCNKDESVGAGYRVIAPLNGESCDPLQSQYGTRNYFYGCSCFGGYSLSNEDRPSQCNDPANPVCCNGFYGFLDVCDPI